MFVRCSEIATKAEAAPSRCDSACRNAVRTAFGRAVDALLSQGGATFAIIIDFQGGYDDQAFAA